MLKQEKGKSNTYIVLLIILVILLIAVIGVGVFSLLKNNDGAQSAGTGLFSKSIKNEVVTADNYQDIAERIGPELNNEDEAYQFLYASMYYVLQDGMASAFNLGATDEEREASAYARVMEKL